MRMPFAPFAMWVATGTSLLPSLASAQSPPAFSTGTYGGVDGLGRVLPEHAEVGAPRPDRFVLMFYFLWHGAHGYDTHRQPPPDGGVWPKAERSYASPYDLTKILAAARDGAPPQYGPEHAFHHWGEPHLGYYLADDEAVLRRHALWLVDAGVDAIALDVTNGLPYTANHQRLLDVYAAMRAAGQPTPQVTFLAHAGARGVTDALWRDLYGPGRHADLWFRWRGKPLLLAPTDGVDPAHRDFFTLRRSWAWSASEWFGDGKDAWPWLDHFPQRAGWHERPDRPEALAVAVAQHPTTNIGRSFHAGQQPPPAEQKPELGLCFAEQWQRALAVRPELVFVTGWNEWLAMRFLADGKTTMLGRPLAKGESYFVDLFSQEYSRDIEPMRGGHEDAYYWHLVAWIRRWKGVPPPPKVSPATTIALDAPAAAWDGVEPVFVDHRGDTFGRDHAGYGAAGPYRQAPAPNDLVLAKVARDDAQVLFLVRAAADLVLDPARQDALQLWIDADADPQTGWCGFDLVVGGRGQRDGLTSIERLSPGYGDRISLGEVRTHRRGTDFVVAVPRALVGGLQAGTGFDFQWTAACGDSGRRVDWLDRGDAAPDGRFVFRWRPH